MNEVWGVVGTIAATGLTGIPGWMAYHHPVEYSRMHSNLFTLLSAGFLVAMAYQIGVNDGVRSTGQFPRHSDTSMQIAGLWLMGAAYLTVCRHYLTTLKNPD